MKPPVPAKDMTQAQLARYIDSAILKPESQRKTSKSMPNRALIWGWTPFV